MQTLGQCAAGSIPQEHQHVEHHVDIWPGNRRLTSAGVCSCHLLGQRVCSYKLLSAAPWPSAAQIKLSLNRLHNANVVCLLAQDVLNYRLQVDSLQAYLNAWLDCAPQREPFLMAPLQPKVGKPTHPTHPVDLRTKAQTGHV